jgi:2-succinyl-5-enolpyruvyl-6-hydroxy-3-cyclohexene-1-carboxylate synthase
MTISTPNRNQLWADLLVEELVRLGVGVFCLAPGSRSTPIVAAIARNEKARAVVHFDERGCAFFALGHAKRSGQLAAVVTTSGTAVANCLPAVVEASAAGVPMLLLTADRPPALRDTGANQTIDQLKVFGGFVRWFFDMPTPDMRTDPALVLTTVDHAVHRARADRGPVHLNLPFADPLIARPPLADVAHPPGLSRWSEGRMPYTSYDSPLVAATGAQVRAVARSVGSTDRGIVVLGELRSELEVAAAGRLASLSGWPVVADVLSRNKGVSGISSLIRHVELLLAADGLPDRLAPQVVLQIGRRPVSKYLLEFFDAAAPDEWVVVDSHPVRQDPHHRVSLRVEADVADFCDAVVAEWDADADSATFSTYLAEWMRASDAAAGAIADGLDGLGLTEMSVPWLIARETPETDSIVIGNSMPVRDLDTYRGPAAASPVVLGNRGSSGIDGTIATAVGVACGTDRGVTAIVGDQTMLHDLNSLALVRASPVPIRVVVVNNDGGGIFSFLPVAEHADLLDPLFAAPHGLTFEKAAGLFGLPYERVDSASVLQNAYRAAVRAGTSLVMEVPSDRERNRVAHNSMQTAVNGAVHAALEGTGREWIGDTNK